MHAGAVCGHDAAAVAAGLERLADLRVQARSRGKAAEAAAARTAAAAQVRPVLIHLLCSGSPSVFAAEPLLSNGTHTSFEMASACVE